MSNFSRAAFNDTFELNAPPSRVFPLLCPVREHDWIPNWKADILYSQSGFAELDCAFATNNPAEGRRTWVCTRYEPHQSVSYASYSDQGYFMLLDVTLKPQGKGTHVTWSRRFVATTPSGEQWVNAINREAASKATQSLAKLLGHYLETGSMLRQ